MSVCSLINNVCDSWALGPDEHVCLEEPLTAAVES